MFEYSVLATTGAKANKRMFYGVVAADSQPEAVRQVVEFYEDRYWEVLSVKTENWETSVISFTNKEMINKIKNEWVMKYTASND